MHKVAVSNKDQFFPFLSTKELGLNAFKSEAFWVPAAKFPPKIFGAVCLAKCVMIWFCTCGMCRFRDVNGLWGRVIRRWKVVLRDNSWWGGRDSNRIDADVTTESNHSSSGSVLLVYWESSLWRGLVRWMQMATTHQLAGWITKSPMVPFARCLFDCTQPFMHVHLTKSHATQLSCRSEKSYM
jgi:hypothetical protein